MTGDLNVSRLSGTALSQFVYIMSNNCYCKSQFGTTTGSCYTKTRSDSLLLPIATDTANSKRVIHRTRGRTGVLVLKYPQLCALGFNNHLDEVTVLFDVNDLLFFKTPKFFSDIEVIQDVKCTTLSGAAGNQLAT